MKSLNRKILGNYKDLEKIWLGKMLKEITQKKNMNFKQFNKYSYCKFCYEICPGLSLLEGKSDIDCDNSGCLISKAIEYLQ